VLAAVKNKPAVATAAPRDDEGFIQAGAKERSRPNKMMGRNGSVDSYQQLKGRLTGKKS
jgi:hypothetical protein